MQDTNTSTHTNSTPQHSAAQPIQPVLFIGHGNPMHAIDDNPFKLEWQAWGQRLRANYPAPRAILVISAHWMTEGWQITSSAQPRTIHDFGGFPAELFAQQYPAPGSPAIAQEIMQTLPQLHIGSDGEQWGLDHGAWTVLMHLFPQANIPVLQLSLNTQASLEEHYRAGQALALLRERGILLIGSGNTVHNFGLMHAPRQHPVWQQVFAFDARIAQALDEQHHHALYQFEQPAARELLRSAHPSLEHYAPLLYAAGASRPSDRVTHVLDGNYPQAPVGMRCAQWG
jgi:4,5-DOPA dioxygenase extradiol